MKISREFILDDHTANVHKSNCIHQLKDVGKKVDKNSNKSLIGYQQFANMSANC